MVVNPIRWAVDNEDSNLVARATVTVLVAVVGVLVAGIEWWETHDE